jgi:hypothetical protein
VYDNPVNGVTRAVGQSFTNDTTKPELEHFDVNMNTGEATFYFSESIRINTYTDSAGTLQGDSAFVSMNVSTFQDLGNNFILSVTFSRLLLDTLKRTSGVAKNNLTTGLSFTEDFVTDMSGNKVVPRIKNNPLDVRLYTPDSIPPRITNFTFDMDNFELVISFSEYVSPAFLNHSSFHFQSLAVQDPNQFVPLSVETQIFQVDSSVLHLRVGLTDMNDIKLKTALCTKNASSCFLSVDEGALLDVDNNKLEAIPRNNGLQAMFFQEDTQAPVLNTWDLDMDTGLITLHFSETMEYASLVRNFLELLNNKTSDNIHQLVLGS